MEPEWPLHLVRNISLVPRWCFGLKPHVLRVPIKCYFVTRMIQASGAIWDSMGGGSSDREGVR